MLQIKIWGDRKAQPFAVLRPHDGHPVYSATFLTAPHRPDHIVLITAVSVAIKFSISFFLFLVNQVFLSKHIMKYSL